MVPGRRSVLKLGSSNVSDENAEASRNLFSVQQIHIDGRLKRTRFNNFTGIEKLTTLQRFVSSSLGSRISGPYNCQAT